MVGCAFAVLPQSEIFGVLFKQRIGNKPVKGHIPQNIGERAAVILRLAPEGDIHSCCRPVFIVCSCAVISANGKRGFNRAVNARVNNNIFVLGHFFKLRGEPSHAEIFLKECINPVKRARVGSASYDKMTAVGINQKAVAGQVFIGRFQTFGKSRVPKQNGVFKAAYFTLGFK